MRSQGNLKLGIETSYDGHSLSYWTEHAYRYYGSQRLENADAVNAIRSMGDTALPFLVKWIATMNHSSQGTDYVSLGLHGFQILGSAAKPAIPDLIKVIGRNNNWPKSALICIGTDAIPALVEFVTTNQTPDDYGDWRRGIPSNEAREYTIATLSRFGTNAEVALPVLLKCYRDETTRSRADVANALASIGHNHPENVVPALIELLTNSTPYLRWSAAEGLGTFGSAATSSIPALVAAGHDSDSQMQIPAAIAVKRIAPQMPDALTPLINNLTNKENWIRRNAIFALESLGTNGLEALPACVERAQRDPDAEVRAEAIHCVALLETNAEEFLIILQLNISGTNESVASAAAQALVNLAEAQSSRSLFLELLFESKTNRYEQVRSIAESSVYEILEKQPALILEPLGSADVESYSVALRFLDGLRRDVLVTDRKEPEPSTNFQAYVMHKMSDENKARFHDAIPLIVKRLGDENFDTRQMATNILLGLDPKEAKKAGVSIVPPYSFYAN
jgi:HEAT repeat protein